MTVWWVAAWLTGCEPKPSTADPVDTTGAVDTTETVDTPTEADTDLPAVAGAFALRRLNREEYDRTTADLLSTTHRYGETFPSEPKTGGFNNVGAGLAISPVWFDLADRAYAQAIRIAGPTAEILNNQGYSYLLRGDRLRARKTLLAAQAKDPSNPYIQNNLNLLDQSLRDSAAVR